MRLEFDDSPRQKLLVGGMGLRRELPRKIDLCLEFDDSPRQGLIVTSLDLYGGMSPHIWVGVASIGVIGRTLSCHC